MKNTTPPPLPPPASLHKHQTHPQKKKKKKKKNTLIRAFLLLEAVLLRSDLRGRAASMGEASITVSISRPVFMFGLGWVVAILL
jgi:hypothetical protein